MRFSVFTFFSLILISAYTPLCVGEVLFEDDFEKNVIDKGKWVPTGTWSADGETLTVNGGEVGITLKDDFTDFEFYVDFHMINPLWAAILGRACGRPKQLHAGSNCGRWS